MTAALFGSAGAGVTAVIVFVYLAIGILDFVAVFKIITKAGYSGWWILLPLAPIVASVVTLIALDRMANSPFSATSVSFDVTTVIGYFVFMGIAIFLNWVFFLIFAFSDWPVRRQLRHAGGLIPPMPYYPPRGPVPPGPVPSSRMVPAHDLSYANAAPGSPRPVGTTPITRPVGTTPTTASAAPMAGPMAGSPCPSCLTPTRAGSSFCGTCGQALIPYEATAAAHAPAPALYDEPADPPGSPGPTSSPDQTETVHVGSEDTQLLDAASRTAGVESVGAETSVATDEQGAPAAIAPVFGDPASHELTCPSCSAPELASSAFCAQCGTPLGSS